MFPIATEAEFHKLVDAIEARPGYRRPAAFALGVARYTDAGAAADLLDVYYPVVNCDEHHASAAILADAVGHDGGSGCHRLDTAALAKVLAAFAPFASDDAHAHRSRTTCQALATLAERGDEAVALSVERPVVCFIDDLAAPPVDGHDVYLRLHLLSHRKVRPHGCALDGMFGLLNNVAWTDHGPVAAPVVDCLRARVRMRGDELQVRSVDKFPRMTDYVVPSGVRIGDADRVRLGAHLAEGTTVMHEGFVNFNAGTLGASMIEGRISAGVVVGDGTDVGGGASIMGTLSGGGSEVIAVGERTLLGANAGLGISLGDDCVVEAGLYLTAGSKVHCTWDDTTCKARELSGADGLLFRRNSCSGAVEAVRGRGAVTLNAELHAN